MNNAEHIELHDSFQSTDLFVFDLKMNWIFFFSFIFIEFIFFKSESTVGRIDLVVLSEILFSSLMQGAPIFLMDSFFKL